MRSISEVTAPLFYTKSLVIFHKKNIFTKKHVTEVYILLHVFLCKIFIGSLFIRLYSFFQKINPPEKILQKMYVQFVQRDANPLILLGFIQRIFRRKR